MLLPVLGQPPRAAGAQEGRGRVLEVLAVTAEVVVVHAGDVGAVGGAVGPQGGAEGAAELVEVGAAAVLALGGGGVKVGATGKRQGDEELG